MYFFVLEWAQDNNETHENECLFKRKHMTVDAGGGRGVLTTMAYTGRLPSKGVPFLVEVYERVRRSVIWVRERAQRANR